jgi:hypothetical protein
MCTLTVFRGDDRLLLTMNRDERWERASEMPPALHLADGERRAWIAPADGERGGTWIGANDDGVVACLLNAYAEGDLELMGRPGVPSRGEIIPRLLALSRDEVFCQIDSGLEARRYPSFMLVVATGDEARVVRWLLGGEVEQTALGAGWQLITSSWWRPDEVAAWRQGRFDAWVANGAPFMGSLPAFNLLVEPGAEEHAPFMTRSYSGTRSLTQVELHHRRGVVHMWYWPRQGREPIDDLSSAIDLQLALRPAGRPRNQRFTQNQED